MEAVDFTRFFLSLAFVIALIWALATLAKRTGMDKKLRGISGGQGRLAVVDVLYLDPRRKLTLVRADDREYLLLITADKAEIIERFEKKA